jgi:3-hydroxyacyl-CoA dehydrogenase/enoyl-CoA hydratase/3-hydroxybutyryl-CoA epimerase
MAEGLENWTLKTDSADIAWLGLRTGGSTNVLSRQVLLELDQVLDAFEKAPPAGLVIYSHKDTGFIAGADVSEFPELRDEQHALQQVRRGQEIFDRLENLPIASVAVLNGITLGGGLELALACTWRIALPSERPVIGLPEVQLGVHPGLGGTVRSVRLIGVRAAMPLMLTGKPLRPAAALSSGLVDRVCEPDEWESTAAELALLNKNNAAAPLIDRVLEHKLLRPLVARMLRSQTSRKANPEHYPAPFAIIDLWREFGSSREGIPAEAQSFARLVFSPTSKNLQRVFFLQDRMKELAKASSTEFKHVHVVGAGTMGADIAAWCAIQGMSVTLQDRESQYVEAGLQKARKTLKRKLKTDKRIAPAAALLVGDVTGEGARSADLIIEAIFEDLEAKQQLFKSLEQRARPEAVLATNTSSIPLEDIAQGLTARQRLIGLHFFNPVALMPLVEVVHTKKTATEVIDEGLAFVRQINKLPLPCLSKPGFVVNRILAPYLDEACRLLQEGVQAEAIDKAATDFGMPVGPLELADSVGLDILVHVATILGDTIGRPVPNALTERVSREEYGQKSGRGFYVWENDKPQKEKPARLAAENDVQLRMMLSLVNEALACLADGVVTDADLVDAGTIFGAGFAPFRGGPLQFARETGVQQLRSELKRLADKHGQRFKASAGWDSLEHEQTQES